MAQWAQAQDSVRGASGFCSMRRAKLGKMAEKADPRNDAAGKKGHDKTQGFKSTSLDCRGMEIYFK